MHCGSAMSVTFGQPPISALLSHRRNRAMCQVESCGRDWRRSQTVRKSKKAKNLFTIIDGRITSN